MGYANKACAQIWACIFLDIEESIEAMNEHPTVCTVITCHNICHIVIVSIKDINCPWKISYSEACFQGIRSPIPTINVHFAVTCIRHDYLLHTIAVQIPNSQGKYISFSCPANCCIELIGVVDIVENSEIYAIACCIIRYNKFWNAIIIDISINKANAAVRSIIGGYKFPDHCLAVNYVEDAISASYNYFCPEVRSKIWRTAAEQIVNR